MNNYIRLTVVFYEYKLDGNSIIITDRSGEEYTLDIGIMEYDGKEELFISGTNEAPYEFQKGSFTRSQFSLF